MATQYAGLTIAADDPMAVAATIDLRGCALREKVVGTWDLIGTATVRADSNLNFKLAT